MSAKIKKTYRYAIKSSFLLTLVTVLLGLVSHILIDKKYGLLYVIICVLIAFLTLIFIIQFRTEKFIYQRIKSLYNDVSILDKKFLQKKTLTTDVDELTRTVRVNVQRYIHKNEKQIATLTEKDSFRKEFIGNVSHELKTPIFTVQGYILTLLDGAGDDKKIREKYLTRANKGVERLTAIVKDLDMIAKLETEGLQMNIEEFDILILIQGVFDLLEMKAKKRDINLCFDKPYKLSNKVIGDAERIEQVLINLIVNSIKYGNVGGTTKVVIEDYSANKYIIRVIDDGEGIGEEHTDRLFERFYRVDRSRSRDQGGSGLGLSIVKHIIEAHNEKIFLESEYGVGSEFSFTLEKSPK